MTDIDSTEDGGTHLPILCLACSRNRGDPDGLGVLTCTSFPDGIPEEIYFWGDDHRTSIAGEEPFDLDPTKGEEFDQWLAFHEAGQRA